MERATPQRPTRRRRAPVTRDRVLRTALRLADEQGIDGVSMRRLGQALKVEAMSLYKHVSGKEDILDGLADLVSAEFTVPVPVPGDDWRAGIRHSAIAAHAVLRRHPWAAAVLESRLSAGPARLRYLDGVVATLFAAGFSPTLTTHALMALDSHTYGFVMQQQAWAFDPADSGRLAAEMAARLPSETYPALFRLVEHAAAGAGAVEVDFTFGLDLLLDGLERLRAGPSADAPEGMSAHPAG